MRINRRKFLGTAAAGGGALAAASGCAGAEARDREASKARETLPPSIAALKPMTDNIMPITVGERQARIAKAQLGVGLDTIEKALPQGK